MARPSTRARCSSAQNRVMGIHWAAVNLRTWGLVSDPIVMIQAFAELRYGVVVHMRENSLQRELGQQNTVSIFCEREKLRAERLSMSEPPRSAGRELALCSQH